MKRPSLIPEPENSEIPLPVATQVKIWMRLVGKERTKHEDELYDALCKSLTFAASVVMVQRHTTNRKT